VYALVIVLYAAAIYLYWRFFVRGGAASAGSPQPSRGG
jgi:hypothetical protein